MTFFDLLMNMHQICYISYAFFVFLHKVCFLFFFLLTFYIYFAKLISD